MKQIVSAFLLLFVLFLISCSNLEQESSPIAPELKKDGTGKINTDGAYDYLQCFNYIPVQSFKSTTTPGTIEIVISPDKFPKLFMHMFVALEYKEGGLPLRNNMIFVGKPNTNIIRVNGILEHTLKSVKVYAYIPNNDWKGITPPYNYLTSFEELVIDEWNISNNQILIYYGDWKPNLRDTFLELTIASSSKQNYLLTYIASPSEGKVIIPKFMKEKIIQIKSYGIFDDSKFE